MADLFNGAGRPSNEAIATRIAQTSSSGLRTPTDVLRQREARDAAREARRLAGIEDNERGNARRGQEEGRRNNAERRTTADGAQPRESGYRHVSVAGKTPMEATFINPLSNLASSTSGPTSRTYARHEPIDSGIGLQGTSQFDANRLQGSSTPQEQSRTSGSHKANAANFDGAKQPKEKSSSSFPQAFERWETMSAHWEGLTSYWLRRMESNAEEIRQEPMAQQMARQITDLTSAGANLFHAVVELQRLRASSERKFQRWFSDTGEKLKQAYQAKTDLESQLSHERDRNKYTINGENEISAKMAASEQLKAQAELVAQAEEEKQTLNRFLAEMKRELQITREEARRAWEELGRREQEERNRIALLNEGHPITIGGVQVVPTSGMASRGNSLRRPEEQDRSHPPETPVVSQNRGNPVYSYDQHEPSPTDTDPFSSGAAPPPSSPVRNPAFNNVGFTAYAPGTMPPYSFSPTQASQPTSPSNQPHRQHQTTTPQHPQSPTQQSQQLHAPYSPTQRIEQPSEPFYHHNSNILHQDQSNSPQQAMMDPDREPSSTHHTRDTEHEHEQSARSQATTTGGALSSITSAMTTGLHTLTDAIGITHSDPKTAQPHTDADSEDRAPKQESPGSDEESYDSAEEAERERARAAQYTSSGGAPYARTHELAVDYEGSGYGGGNDVAGSGQSSSSTAGAVDSRHHHPTRLSDVVEEDERSRTTRRSSGSAASRGGAQ